MTVSVSTAVPTVTVPLVSKVNVNGVTLVDEKEMNEFVVTTTTGMVAVMFVTSEKTKDVVVMVKVVVVVGSE